MKIKQFVYITDIDSFLAGNYGNSFSLYDSGSMSDYDGWHLVGDIVIDVNVNLETLTAEAVECIEKAEQKELAEHEVKMGLLDEKKQKLLCIEHKE